MAMITWCVRYRFMNNSRWTESYFYVDKTSPEEARAAAENMLTSAITAKWEILNVRMVGGETTMFWVFVDYGCSEDMPLKGICKTVAGDEAEARANVESFLKKSGYNFIKITEVQVA